MTSPLERKKNMVFHCFIYVPKASRILCEAYMMFEKLKYLQFFNSLNLNCAGKLFSKDIL